MLRPARSRLSPWIESLIMSYGTQPQTSSSGRLKADVIGVGPMSQSQGQSSDSPSGLLFLSDGMLQIPAILTVSAWEKLQEKEDRESFTSLVNTTVCIQDYQLQFNMAPEQTKCRFFLSVGELATTAAGLVKDNTPCCMTLSSVRLMICKMWKAQLGQEVQESQASQCGFDLTELLGEWQHDCMQAVMEDVRERLTVSSRSVSPQPSTSTYTKLQTHRDTFTTMSWDVDRVRYKREKCFTVPIKCLLIPEDNTLQLQTPQNVGSRTPSWLPTVSQGRKRNLLQVFKLSERTQPSVDEAQWRIAKPAGAERATNKTSPSPVQDSMLHEVMIAGMIDTEIRPLSNPWDVFPPPCETSSSDPSPEATPTHSLHNPTAAESKTDHAAILTSTRLPESPKNSHQISEHSYLPPYQRPPFSSHCSASACTPTSTCDIPPESFTRPSKLLPATDKLCTNTAQKNPPALDQESQILQNTKETVERKCRKAKRKRSEPTPEELSLLVEEEKKEAHLSRSPPSWLFDSQAGSRVKDDSSQQQCQTVWMVQRATPTVHSDGQPFSYSYSVSGQIVQDFSQFKVRESLLHWAAEYLLVPEETDNPYNTLASSNQTSSDRAKVTSL